VGWIGLHHKYHLAKIAAEASPMRRHRTLIASPSKWQMSAVPMPHPAIRFSQLAGPKAPFLCNQNQDLGEELVASHLDQVIRAILAIGLRPTITDASSSGLGTADRARIMQIGFVGVDGSDCRPAQ